MKFDTDDYRRKLKDPATRLHAEQSLEFAIQRAPIDQAIELKKLRTPGAVTLIELKRLKAAGFPEDKLTPDGELEILVLAWKAGAEHAKRYWSEPVARYYSMDNYRLSEDAA